MSNLNTHNVEDFASADRWLGDHANRQLCYATRLVRSFGGSILVQHHNTGIIRYEKDGTILIRTAGYESATTVNRLHQMTPNTVRVSRAKGGKVESLSLPYTGPLPHEWQRVV